MESVTTVKQQILESNELSTTLLIKTIINDFCAKLINAALTAIPNDDIDTQKFSKALLVQNLQKVFNEQQEENIKLYQKLDDLIKASKDSEKRS